MEYDDTEDMKSLAIRRLAQETDIPQAAAAKFFRQYPDCLTVMLMKLYREKLAWLNSEECREWLESNFGRRGCGYRVRAGRHTPRRDGRF